MAGLVGETGWVPELLRTLTKNFDLLKKLVSLFEALNYQVRHNGDFTIRVNYKESLKNPMIFRINQRELTTIGGSAGAIGWGTTILQLKIEFFVPSQKPACLLVVSNYQVQNNGDTSRSSLCDP